MVTPCVEGKKGKHWWTLYSNRYNCRLNFDWTVLLYFKQWNSPQDIYFCYLQSIAKRHCFMLSKKFRYTITTESYKSEWNSNFNYMLLICFLSSAIEASFCPFAPTTFHGLVCTKSLIIDQLCIKTSVFYSMHVICVIIS